MFQRFEGFNKINLTLEHHVCLKSILVETKMNTEPHLVENCISKSRFILFYQTYANCDVEMYTVRIFLSFVFCVKFRLQVVLFSSSQLSSVYSLKNQQKQIITFFYLLLLFSSSMNFEGLLADL